MSRARLRSKLLEKKEIILDAVELVEEQQMIQRNRSN